MGIGRLTVGCFCRVVCRRQPYRPGGSASKGNRVSVFLLRRAWPISSQGVLCHRQINQLAESFWLLPHPRLWELRYLCLAANGTHPFRTRLLLRPLKRPLTHPKNSSRAVPSAF